ncbi:hypothetical protein KC946_03690 [Candidatus Saccharibacteria bacterium]|nr:hypothetical protein [Candidatus Saccharibacteria bacterium]
MERILDDSEVLIRQGWIEAASQILTDGRNLKDEAVIHGEYLSRLVINSDLEVSDLRQGVAWANAYDREAVQLLGNISDQDLAYGDMLEASARRLAHHSGRVALSNVGSNSRRAVFNVRCYQLGYQAENTESILRINDNIGLR